jgi:hypothetical protein
MKTDVNFYTSKKNVSLHHRVQYSLSFTCTKPQEKIKIFLETSNGTLILPMNEIHKTVSNGKIVIHGKCFDEK